MRNTIEAANDELRRVRREISRGESEPLRFVIAGGRAKPVSSARRRRWLATLGSALALCAFAGSLVGWGQPAGALGALSNAIAPFRQDLRSEPNESLPARTYSELMLTPRLQADAVPEGEHFTVEVSNTGKAVKLHLTGLAGEPDGDSYLALRHELRCQRTGAESPIDPRLIELLHRIALESGSSIQVVSAFRAPVRAGDVNYHTKGMAADIRVPDMTTEELRDLARTLGANGVGYYPTVRFVHVDVRSTPYFWTDTSGHTDHSRDDDQIIQDDSAAREEPAAKSSRASDTTEAQPSVPPPAGASLVPTAERPLIDPLPRPGLSALEQAPPTRQR